MRRNNMNAQRLALQIDKCPQTVVPIGGSFTLDMNTSGGMAFLEGQLEKIDPKLREPLKSIWWPRDIVAKTGGGFVEYTSSFNVSYATTGGNQNGIISGSTNNIPVMQADIDKDLYKVFTWAHTLRVPYVNQQKLQQIGRNLEEMLNTGLKLEHDKTLDINVYEGFPDYGTYGLINHPSIQTVMASENVGSKTEWKYKAPDELLADVNKIMIDTWEASGYDLSGMANHILIPPEQYAHIVRQKVSEAADKSVLKFLLENNIGKEQGRDLFIGPLPMLKGAGTGGSDRMIGYANDEDMVRFSITSPLSRTMVQPSVEQLSYLSAFVAQFGQVEFLYYTPVEYMDGI